MLKKIISQAEPHELRITRLFSSPPFGQNPRNHCVPLLDVVEIPNTSQKLMVMPLLRSLCPRFQTFGEFGAFFAQICEVMSLECSSLRFNLYNHWIRASNSCMNETLHTGTRECLQMDALLRPFRDRIMNNVMFDTSEICPRGFNHTRRCAFNTKAKHFRRTQRSPAPRYYLLISGLSRHYMSRDDLEAPPRNGDDTASMRQGETPCNPFHTDIYRLGNLVRHEFMRVRFVMLTSLCS